MSLPVLRIGGCGAAPCASSPQFQTKVMLFTGNIAGWPYYDGLNSKVDPYPDPLPPRPRFGGCSPVSGVQAKGTYRVTPSEPSETCEEFSCSSPLWDVDGLEAQLAANMVEGCAYQVTDAEGTDLVPGAVSAAHSSLAGYSFADLLWGQFRLVEVSRSGVFSTSTGFIFPGLSYTRTGTLRLGSAGFGTDGLFYSCGLSMARCQYRLLRRSRVWLSEPGDDTTPCSGGGVTPGIYPAGTIFEPEFDTSKRCRQFNAVDPEIMNRCPEGV